MEACSGRPWKSAISAHHADIIHDAHTNHPNTLSLTLQQHDHRNHPNILSLTLQKCRGTPLDTELRPTSQILWKRGNLGLFHSISLFFMIQEMRNIWSVKLYVWLWSPCYTIQTIYVLLLALMKVFQYISPD